MSGSTDEHKKGAPRNIRVAILIVSTTRSLADDKSGKWISSAATKNGNTVVFHDVVTDDIDAIRKEAESIIDSYKPHVLLVSGGTGISPKDVTIEALRPLFDKELSAFGTLFAQLSYEQIDSAAILSRATAGVAKGVILFCMPGSIKACKLACKYLIFPELGHLVKHVGE
jgi:molybdopterin adenylyltransferase